MLVDDDDLAESVAVRSLGEKSAAAGSVLVKRYKRTGSRAVVAAEFVSARTGSLRRGFSGVVFRDGLWRPSGGWSSDVVQAAEADDIWLNSGGWSNGDWTVHGGWVADASAARFRAVDPGGRAEQDTLSDGIAILIWEGDLHHEARGELIDVEGRAVRSGLVLRPRHPLIQ